MVGHWLAMLLGPYSNSEILLYIGPNDIRYYALVLGAIKDGYSVRGYLPGIYTKLSECDAT